MMTQHLYLCSADAPTPERLLEAFPDLQSLDLPALLARYGTHCLPDAGADLVPCLVWLSASAAQWVQQLRQILQARPQARVVLLSGAPEPVEGLRALNEGVRGYTHAYGVPALLQEVGVVVAHGGLWVGPDLLQRLVGATHTALGSRAGARGAASAGGSAAATGQVAPNAWTALSPREAQVARLVAAGRSNKEVADSLFISERTVKAHLGTIFDKLAVRDRLQLVLRLAGSAQPGATNAAM